MSVIFSRSPYLIEVDEADQVSSKLEIYIWNSGSQPASPQYTLSKKIPASNSLQTIYNVSPYIREYYNFANFTGDNGLYNNPTSTSHYCNVRVTRLVTDSSGERSIDSTLYRAFDGYGYYEEGSNPDLGNVMLSEGHYSYKKLGGADIVSQIQNLAGSITMLTGTSDKLRYTSLTSGAIFEANLTDASIINADRIYAVYRDEGNKVEYLTGGSSVAWTAYFRPIEECKYTPIYIDYINKQGAWSRMFLFKTSKTSISVQSKDYNLMQSNALSYDALEGQVKQFNTNGKETIKGNTGFVREDFFPQLRELMLSERVLVNSRPAKVNTQSVDKQTGLDNKTMSYGLEFSFNNNIINKVV